MCNSSGVRARYDFTFLDVVSVYKIYFMNKAAVVNGALRYSSSLSLSRSLSLSISALFSRSLSSFDLTFRENK